MRPKNRNASALLVLRPCLAPRVPNRKISNRHLCSGSMTSAIRPFDSARRDLLKLSSAGLAASAPDGRLLAHPVLISDDWRPTLAVGRTLAHPWDTRSPAQYRVRVE